MRTTPLVDAAADVSRVRFGDGRLDRRARSLSRALQARPSESFPKALADEAAVEAFYRFMANDKVEWDAVLGGHVEATHERAVVAGRILALHDSSLFQFGGDAVRVGAFRTAKGKSGFLGHTCLAVSADGARQPLGVLGMIPVVRLDGEAAETSPGTVYDCESDRWIDLVDEVEESVPMAVDIVHVMDSEGDSFDLLEFMVADGVDFVVRLCHDRRVVTTDGRARLSDALPQAQTRFTRTVPLSTRKGVKKSGRHAARDERLANLEVRVLKAGLLRPDGSDAHLAGVHVHIVQVVEVDPPEGEAPVSWLLATRLPVDTDEAVADVVDFYRARWLIEEWFKALKTGCAYQKRQLESLGALLVAFALLAPISTRLLALRWLGRNEPERPASDVLDDDEIACLRVLERQKRRGLPRAPTVGDVLLAVARLGGFLTRNKVPGWQVLGRGFEDLAKMVAMFRAMQGGGMEM
jgi:hypothetical protein